MAQRSCPYLMSGALLLCACASAPQAAPSEPTDDVAAATEVVESEPQTAWAFLAARYDADGDGRIAFDEYGRGQVAFARLDADADGWIDAADFEGELNGVTMLTAQLLMGLYLQDDDDPGRLDSAELEAAFGAYDENFDAILSPAEFEARHRERARHGRAFEDTVMQIMTEFGPYAVLCEGIDTNRDGVIDYDEVIALQSRFFPDGNLMPVYARSEDAAAGRALARVGELAPDFTLETADGERSVTLSDFRGKKPVALIFGSYT